MQDIHIKRYQKPDSPGEGFPSRLGEVEPEDRSWLLTISDDGPRLFIRTKVEDEDGTVRHGYVNVRQIPDDLTAKDIAESTFTGPNVEPPDDYPQC
jgi:hypothetical protein